jgi:hypothetical protein
VIDSTVRNVTAKVNTEDYRLETAKEEVLYLLYGNTFIEKYKEIIQSSLHQKG